mgnify:CR=1 FL=1
MKKIVRKIKQSRGASITFALAFYLVAAMVCTTIIAASVTAVKRTNVTAEEMEEEQAKLTLESSARLIREGMRDTKVTAKRTVHYEDDGVTVKDTDAPVYQSSGNLAGLAEQAIRTLYENSTLNPWDSSVGFADYLQRQANAAVRHLCFVIGGAYGFSNEVYKAAHDKVSLSPMTFNHQMVRLFFAEQLYRAFTILNHEKYHNV